MPHIELHFFQHDTEDLQALSRSTSIIREALENVSGKVWVFHEQADLPPSDVEIINHYMQEGVSPLLAPVTPFSELTPAEISNLINLNLLDHPDHLSLAQNYLTTHTFAELLQLTSLQQEFLDPHGNPRLGIVFEPSHQLDSLIENYDVYQDLILQYFELGQFDDALVLFKQTVQNMATVALHREQKVAYKISQYADLPDTSIVFIRYGTGHTGIYHTLRRNSRQTTVNRILLDKEAEASKFYFQPEDAAIRKVMLLGFNSLGQIEWFRYLAGTVIYTSLKHVKHQAIKHISDQSLIQMTYGLMTNYQHDADLKLQHQLILEHGLYQGFQLFHRHKSN